MSDMSLPPLSLVSLAKEGGGPPTLPPISVLPAIKPFAWPTPPTPGYPAPAGQTASEPCEIEGPNGKINVGRMIAFDAEAGMVHLQVPPSRTVLTLKLTQFRRLTLARPLAPLAKPAGADFDATTPLLPHNPLQPCRLRFKDGSEITVETFGRVDTPLGVFTFTPVDANGGVRRAFYPRPMLAAEPLLAEADLALHQAADAQATPPMPLDTLPPESPARAWQLGDIMGTALIVNPEQLIAAIDQQATMPMVRIGEALLALNMITEKKLAETLQLQSRDRSLPLGELLVRRGDVSRADLQTALARKMGYPIVDVSVFPVEPEAALRLPLAVARRLPALPLILRGGRLVMALEDPTARNLIDEIEFSAQCKVLPVLARSGALLAAIDRVYTRLGQDRARSSAPPALAATPTAPTARTGCWPTWCSSRRTRSATTTRRSSRATTRWCG